MKKRTTIALLIGIMVFTTLLAGCRSGTDPAETSGDPTELNSKEFFAMDTYMEIRGYGASDELLDEASKAVTDLEKLISTTYDGSEIAQINAAGSGTVTGEAEELLLESLFLCDELQGTLDISIYPVVKAWGGRDDFYAQFGECQQVLQMDGVHGRFTRNEDKRTAFLQHDVGGPGQQVV